MVHRKTLLARSIGNLLNTEKPIVVEGPQLLSKYVGESEQNVRKLFEPAEKNPDKLFLIICDEFDALCKKRGSKSDSTGVGDNIVNQFLSKMDGVEQLNNVIIIAMTNRKELIDEALLRPGRFEVHLEISLPDALGRLDILNIHTIKMKNNDKIDSSVDLKSITSLTTNFTGAELEGLVRSAVSFSLKRNSSINEKGISFH